MDHYSVLGVKPNATKSQIKDAFKKLAMKLHPDKHTDSSKSVQNDATSKFKQVSEAYEVLTNDSKRAEYDSRCGYGRGSRSNRGGVASASASASTSSFYGGKGSGDFDAFKERCRYRYRHGGGGESVVRFLSSPVVLIGIAFASMVAATFIFENRRGKLCKIPACGKSYEESTEFPRRSTLRQHYTARRGSGHSRHYYYNYPPCGEE